jgi:hypothetical protein
VALHPIHRQGVEEPEDLLGVSPVVVTAVAGFVGTMRGMSYSSDLTDEQWAEPAKPGQRGTASRTLGVDTEKRRPSFHAPKENLCCLA